MTGFYPVPREASHERLAQNVGVVDSFLRKGSAWGSSIERPFALSRTRAGGKEEEGTPEAQ